MSCADRAVFVGLVHQADAEVDDVLGEHVARIRREEPAYESIPLDELRRDARALLRSSLTAMAVGGPPDVSLAGATAQRRAEQGVPLGPLLHAFRLGVTVIWERLVALAQRAGPGAQVALLAQAERVWAVSDAFATEVTAAYQDGLVALADRDARRRLEAITALVEGRTADWSLMSGTAALIGLPEGVACVALSAVPDDAAEDATPLPDVLRAAGFATALVNRSGRWTGLVAVPRADAVTALLRALRTRWRGRAGVSGTFGDLSLSPGAVRDAVAAERCVPRGTAGAACFDEDRLALLLTDSPELARRTARAFLGRLLDEPDAAELLALVGVLFESGSVAQTAERLFLHRNTVSRRLRRVEELTGRPLDSARGSAELYVAVRTVALLG